MKPPSWSRGRSIVATLSGPSTCSFPSIEEKGTLLLILDDIDGLATSADFSHRLNDEAAQFYQRSSAANVTSVRC